MRWRQSGQGLAPGFIRGCSRNWVMRDRVPGFPRDASPASSKVQNDPVCLNGDRVGLSGQRLYCRRLGGLDSDFVGADAGAVGLADGAAGGEVEFPAVPGAAEDLAVARPQVLAGGGGQGHSLDAAQAERAALVGTTVPQGVEGTVDVEDADGAALYFHDLP